MRSFLPIFIAVWLLCASGALARVCDNEIIGLAFRAASSGLPSSFIVSSDHASIAIRSGVATPPIFIDALATVGVNGRISSPPASMPSGAGVSILATNQLGVTYNCGLFPFGGDSGVGTTANVSLVLPADVWDVSATFVNSSATTTSVTLSLGRFVSRATDNDVDMVMSCDAAAPSAVRLVPYITNNTSWSSAIVSPLAVRYPGQTLPATVLRALPPIQVRVLNTLMVDWCPSLPMWVQAVPTGLPSGSTVLLANATAPVTNGTALFGSLMFTTGSGSVTLRFDVVDSLGAAVSGVDTFSLTFTLSTMSRPAAAVVFLERCAPYSLSNVAAGPEIQSVVALGVRLPPLTIHAVTSLWGLDEFTDGVVVVSSATLNLSGTVAAMRAGAATFRQLKIVDGDAASLHVFDFQLMRPLLAPASSFMGEDNNATMSLQSRPFRVAQGALHLGFDPRSPWMAVEARPFATSAGATLPVFRLSVMNANGGVVAVDGARVALVSYPEGSVTGVLSADVIDGVATFESIVVAPRAASQFRLQFVAHDTAGQGRSFERSSVRTGAISVSSTAVAVGGLGFSQTVGASHFTLEFGTNLVGAWAELIVVEGTRLPPITVHVLGSDGAIARASQGVEVRAVLAGGSCVVTGGSAFTYNGEALFPALRFVSCGASSGAALLRFTLASDDSVVAPLRAPAADLIAGWVVVMPAGTWSGVPLGLTVNASAGAAPLNPAWPRLGSDTRVSITAVDAGGYSEGALSGLQVTDTLPAASNIDCFVAWDPYAPNQAGGVIVATPGEVALTVPANSNTRTAVFGVCSESTLQPCIVFHLDTTPTADAALTIRSEPTPRRFNSYAGTVSINVSASLALVGTTGSSQAAVPLDPGSITLEAAQALELGLDSPRDAPTDGRFALTVAAASTSATTMPVVLTPLLPNDWVTPSVRRLGMFLRTPPWQFRLGGWAVAIADYFGLDPSRLVVERVVPAHIGAWGTRVELHLDGPTTATLSRATTGTSETQMLSFSDSCSTPSVLAVASVFDARAAPSVCDEQYFRERVEAARHCEAWVGASRCACFSGIFFDGTAAACRDATYLIPVCDYVRGCEAGATLCNEVLPNRGIRALIVVLVTLGVVATFAVGMRLLSRRSVKGKRPVANRVRDYIVAPRESLTDVFL